MRIVFGTLVVSLKYFIMPRAYSEGPAKPNYLRVLYNCREVWGRNGGKCENSYYHYRTASCRFGYANRSIVFYCHCFFPTQLLGIPDLYLYRVPRFTARRHTETFRKIICASNRYRFRICRLLSIVLDFVPL